ncbi:acyltransferase family protein [Actinokineospora iranica]|uniref:Peptidoglycan/LPS O-acetylase OafA/YrhL, contains acyltransferase and SGNH-hydrolase domains n=1 Tax=Actinokineospora iranica TaxID=1271860 RepID=A0A1G6LCQ2_9PSEU|nr:acyltransferase family protein [Actinokineospora iranica]SDC40998.1 Peptidoglycan/LPS O-acetylase OafA/YrhL, contains acyltransferase and SGNH-hydrolase domains [Actinokineospora iranica]
MATQVRAQSTPDATSRTPKGFRPDIQALRAVAVLAVVVNHLWPTGLTGGYVGVDVFFVISGFLISSHLDREILRTGRVRLGRFYARRVRRLLPAAFLVLLASLAAAYFLLPYPRWEANAHEALAAALYWENWLLAVNSVDYSALTAAASLAQHYWSLSVEEQFYLLWPLLLLLLFKIRGRRAQVVGVLAVGAASLAFCVYFTEVSKSQAYFVTPGRVWEFAIGALIALAGARLALPRVAAGVAAAAGLALIVGSAVLFDHHTAFPGLLALVPTVGTGLVIVAGAAGERQWHSVVTSSAPVQFLGNISYSLYLWHWPMIVLAPYALADFLDDGKLTFAHRAGVLVAAVALAWVSKRLVEDRGMTWAPLANSTRATFAAMVAGMAAVALVAGGLTWTYDQHVTQAAQAAREARAHAVDPCHGAAALVPGSGCADPFGPAKVVHMGPANEYFWSPPECGEHLDTYLAGGRKTTKVCDYSGGAPSPTVVWLVGDSHAQQWQGPLLDLARENRWVLKLSYLGGCPFARIPFVGFNGSASPADAKRCTDWTAMMAEEIAKDRPDRVFTSFYARKQPARDTTGRGQEQHYRDGLEPYWRRWTDAGAQVHVLGDPPLNGEVRAADCVALNPEDPVACAVDRAVAQPPDPLGAAAEATDNPGVTHIDLTDYFCDQRQCYGVVGDVAVYYDANHLNLEFSRSLRPMIAAAIGLPTG